MKHNNDFEAALKDIYGKVMFYVDKSRHHYDCFYGGKSSHVGQLTTGYRLNKLDLMCEQILYKLGLQL
jgi:hypothetical protein